MALTSISGNRSARSYSSAADQLSPMKALGSNGFGQMSLCGMAWPIVTAPLASLALASAHQARNQGDHEQDDEDPEEKPGTLHRDTRDASEADRRCDQGDDEEDDRVVQERE